MLLFGCIAISSNIIHLHLVSWTADESEEARIMFRYVAVRANQLSPARYVGLFFLLAENLHPALRVLSFMYLSAGRKLRQASWI
jgi:hypothetical protein